MRMLFALLACSVCISCDALPKDPDGTVERVRGGSFRVGMIASPPLPSADRTPAAGKAQRFVEGVAASAEARPEVVAGAAEPLLSMLEAGELDLVVGPMTEKSPWMTTVTFLPPLEKDMTGDGHHQLVAMARNGENAWITLLDREARKVAAQ